MDHSRGESINVASFTYTTDDGKDLSSGSECADCHVDTTLPRHHASDSRFYNEKVQKNPGIVAETPVLKCKCQVKADGSRNLVVCIDGTANQFSFQVGRSV